MGSPAIDDETDEKPLDPAMEKVRRKMVRLLAVSIGIMLAGLMAVLFTIVYKTSSGGPEARGAMPAQGELLTGRIALPAGARVLSGSLSGERILLHVALPDGSEQIQLYDYAAGRMIGRFEIAEE